MHKREGTRHQSGQPKLLVLEGETMKKKIALMLAVMLVAVMFVACANTDKPADPKPTETVEVTPTPEATPEAVPESTTDTTTEISDDVITITDMTGREITIDGPVTSIVALSPADCEILFTLLAGDLIIGRGEYCNYPPAVLDVPSVETGYQLNVEQVIALNPQVIIMTSMAQSEEQVAALEAAGAKVVVISAHDIEGTYQAIGIIGQLTGDPVMASGLVAAMKDDFANIERMADGDGSKTVYFEVSPLEWGLWTAGSGTFMDELATMLGLTNAFADVEGWGAVSQEQVIERDPDYIVTIAMYFGEGALPVDEILSRSGWENMKAIKNGAVYNADNDAVARPGPRLADAAKSLYDFVYGE